MGLRSLYIRTSGILRNPGEEFVQISAERKSVTGINTGVIVPYALMIAIFSMIGSLFQHLQTPLNSYLFILLDAVIVFFIILFQVYISGLISFRIARWMSVSQNRRQVYALVAWSEVPFLLVLSLIKLFPSLIFMIFLGLYSGYVLYAGIDKLYRLSEQKRIQFMLLTLLVMVSMFILLSELFSYLYSEIIAQIATFAIL